MVLSDEQQKEAPDCSGAFFCTCLQFNLKPPRSYPDAPEVPRWWSGIRMAYMEAYSKKAVQALDHIAKEDCQSVYTQLQIEEDLLYAFIRRCLVAWSFGTNSCGTNVVKCFHPSFLFSSRQRRRLSANCCFFSID
jgi:hypothetical protein